jgi:hypothetical protein
MDPRGPVIDAILEDANTAATLDSFRRSMVSRLSTFIGLDSGAVHAAVPPPHGAGSGSVALNMRPDLFDRFLRDQPRYFVSARPILGALDAGGGLGIDTDALGATARRRLAIYSEILVPSGVTCMLGSVLTFRGDTHGILVLCRGAYRRPCGGCLPGGRARRAPTLTCALLTIASRVRVTATLLSWRRTRHFYFGLT